jgi:pimeloyl-ACP methyl ester carboxylesterase
MYVEDAGSGPALLTIPGLGGGAHFFNAFAKRMQPGHRVVAIDLPGTWRSPSDAAVTMESWVADLGTLVERRVGGPVVLIGHSMGTMIALQGWRAWPQHVRGLVFVGGLPRVRPAVRERLEERLRALKDASDLLGWGPRVSPANFFPATMRERPEIVALFERLFELQRLDDYRRSLQVLLDADASAILPSVTAPVLAVTGADDQYAPPDAVDAFIRQLPGPARHVVIPDCGHLPFFERPEAFAEAVSTFVQSC